MKKKIIIGIIIIIVLILGIKSLFFNKVGEIMIVYDNETCQSSIYHNDKMIGQIDGEANFMKNMNNTGCYIYTEHISGCCFDNHEKDVVYYLKGNDLFLVGEDMRLVSVATHSKESLLIDKKDCLYRFDGKNLEQLTSCEIENVAISGNGKYYGYYSNGNSYFGKKPENEVKVSGVMIGYISDNAQCIYGFDAKNCIGFYDRLGYDISNADMYKIDKMGEKELIAYQVKDVVCLNENGKSIMYTTENGTFICKNGNTSEKISEKQAETAYFNDDNKNWVNDFGPFKSFDGVICCLEAENNNNTIGVIENSSSVKEIFTEKYLDIIELNSENNKALFEVYASNGDYNYYIMDLKDETCSLVVNSDAAMSCMDVESEYFYYFDGDINKNNVGVVNFNCSLYYCDANCKVDTVNGTFGGVKDIVSYEDGCFVSDAEGVYYVEGKHVEKLDDFDGIVGFFKSDKDDTMYAYDENNVYKVNGFKLKKLEGEFENIKFGEAID